jgi:hypothetical protein
LDVAEEMDVPESKKGYAGEEKIEGESAEQQ